MENKFSQIVSQVSVLLILATLTCCNQHPITPELALAEQLMEQKPDSALKVIQQIKNPEGLSSREHALYCLFLTLANDKNYVTHSSDSVIKIAVNYFDKHNDPKYQMLAYYCMGRVNTDLEDALQAQECYLKALDLEENSKDYRLLVKLYNSLGNLYVRQGLDDMAIPMYKKVLYYTQIDQQLDSLNISFGYRNLARTYSQIQQIDSAINYCKQALSFSVQENRSSILLDLGNLHFNKNEFNSAYQYIEQAIVLMR